ncbi:acyltransferase domain-containing protein [Agrobacterium sp. a22-2]|uniref:type I polyketide synthase n=1 Tax=Agrobacterium sp. a22-2 TaxID=2283840 RepID=UPI00144736DD|nr:type I polyketide synthase [Agrobacterium sp. a22-2]NKN37350.1 acyltransferase domain-containing protein [Agrobacterium sp. a22-2]
MIDAETPAQDIIDQDQIFEILKEARLRLEAGQREKDERVAIVGMAGRFPGADDIDQFWRLLEQGRSGLRPVTDRELEEAGVDPETAARPDYVRVWGGFDDPTAFDAGFFGYSPRDAELLDPQHRVFLECAAGALDHAGYDSRAYPGRIGVYAGGALTYHFSHIQANRALKEATDPIHAGLGNVLGMIASRVAYHLDLTGPTVGVQATCATALVALHLAARGLLAREADMALAGAVAIGQPQPEGYLYKSEGIGSPDGVCRPFDVNAKGTVFTNGVGVLVLKRLSDAIADGDTIHAILRGSAIGNDGSAKVGLTAPSVAGQTAVLEAALADARLDPSAVDYIEAHGTGTTLGDPIEVQSLTRVYGGALKREGRSCGLGSVKGNLGHMDVAAGMGGLIKTILAMKYQILPASINFTAPSPSLDLRASPFEIIAEQRPWMAASDRIRRAAVSAFGMGGMNAHIILEEPPVREQTADEGGPYLLPLSARTPEALAAMRSTFADYLGADDASPLADIAYTLRTGRQAMGWRFVALALDRDDAARILRTGDGPDCVAGKPLSGDPNLIFLFPGQGAQYPGMARALYETDGTFRAAFDACLGFMPAELDLATIIFGDDATAERLTRTEATQPALFAVEYALAQMWLAKGAKPRAMVGHSIGEYVAACIAGVFSLEDAVKLVVARGRLMQACPPGAMLSVMLSENEARALLSPDVELAAVNGPRSTVLAGTAKAIVELAARFDRSGIGSRELKTSHAFHSFMMEPALHAFARVLSTVTLNPPAIDMVSNLTGNWLTAKEATDPTYWVEHLRRTVLFGPGLARVLELPDAVLLEVGPGSTLTRLARQQGRAELRVATSLPDAAADGNAAHHATLALAELWIAGVDVDLVAREDIGPRRRVPLPAYPFQRSPYRIPLTAPAEPAQDGAARLPAIQDWFHQPVWRRAPFERPSTSHDEYWLVFGDEEVVAAIGPVPDRINVIWVKPGNTYLATPSAYQLCPTNPEHYRALLADLAGNGRTPTQIVNGFFLDANAQPDAAFATTFALAQSLIGSEARPPLLTVLSCGLHEVTGAETLDAQAAKVLGTLRVLPWDIPGLSCRSIDLPPQRNAIVPGLIDALSRPLREDRVVTALRNGYLWFEDYAPVLLSEPVDVPALAAGATYLIAGDLLDGLALVYARALVQTLGAKVVFAGPSGLPAAADWEHWLASHGPKHPVSQFIRALRGIGTPGDDYMLFSGDFTDPAWLASCLKALGAPFGPIRGVFQTAGMGEVYHCPLIEATAERNAALFATKVDGLKALSEALAGHRPDFVLVQSSLSTLVGGTGLAAYAGANSFLDAFVDARRGEDRPVWQAIAWDTCLPYGTTREEAAGFFSDAIDADEVWRTTRSVLAHPEVSRLAVTPIDLRHRMTAVPQEPRAVVGMDPNEKTGRERVQATFVAPRDPVETDVAAVMEDLLGISRVGIDDNFFELGGHSLLAVQVVTRLRKQFLTELPMRALLFEAPTVRGIAAAIRERLDVARKEQEELIALLDDIEASAPRKEA